MRPRARKGYTLILAIVLVGAIGVTLALMGRHFVMTTRSVSHAELEARAAQLLASGRAWVAAHREECESLAAGESLDLPVRDLAPGCSLTSLTITRHADEPALVVTATAARGLQSSKFRTSARP